MYDNGFPPASSASAFVVVLQQTTFLSQQGVHVFASLSGERLTFLITVTSQTDAQFLDIKAITN